MITAIVEYALPPSIGRQECLEHFTKIAPGFGNNRDSYASTSSTTMPASAAVPICGKHKRTPSAFIQGRGWMAFALATASIPKSRILKHW